MRGFGNDSGRIIICPPTLRRQVEYRTYGKSPHCSHIPFHYYNNCPNNSPENHHGRTIEHYAEEAMQAALIFFSLYYGLIVSLYLIGLIKWGRRYCLNRYGYCQASLMAYLVVYSLFTPFIVPFVLFYYAREKWQAD